MGHKQLGGEEEDDAEQLFRGEKANLEMTRRVFWSKGEKEVQGTSSQFPSDLGVGSGGGALVVNRRRQEGNPVLKYVRNVRYEWGECGADFECGPAFGVVYLSFKYHKQHPEYVYSRINGKAENRYRNKVLLGYCNMEEPRHVLRELNMICFREAWTLVVVYTVEEAAEYIELFKTTQKKEIQIK
uniref:GIY-YIG domain-containing protein n=1 Tax=Caenorhabditis tropicalis TaxID=1561998 RepID=A0A1I7UXB3_9PELO